MNYAGLSAVTGQLADIVRDEITTHASTQADANFCWNWAANPDEVESFPYFLDFLVKSRNLRAAIVSKGQNIDNAKLIAITVVAPRRNLRVVNGELIAGEVVDVFKINGNTDLVRLRTHAGDTSYISRSQVQYAILIKSEGMLETEFNLTCSLREAMLLLIGLNSENSFTSPAVLLTNYNDKHYVLYIDWPEEKLQKIKMRKLDFSLEIRHFINLNEAIDFAETLTLREPGTMEFLNRFPRIRGWR